MQRGSARGTPAEGLHESTDRIEDRVAEHEEEIATADPGKDHGRRRTGDSKPRRSTSRVRVSAVPVSWSRANATIAPKATTAATSHDDAGGEASGGRRTTERQTDEEAVGDPSLFQDHVPDGSARTPIARTAGMPTAASTIQGRTRRARRVTARRTRRTPDRPPRPAAWCLPRSRGPDSPVRAPPMAALTNSIGEGGPTDAGPSR